MLKKRESVNHPVWCPTLCWSCYWHLNILFASCLTTCTSIYIVSVSSWMDGTMTLILFFLKNIGKLIWHYCQLSIKYGAPYANLSMQTLSAAKLHVVSTLSNTIPCTLWYDVYLPSHNPGFRLTSIIIRLRVACCWHL